MVELVETWDGIVALAPEWQALDARAGHPLLCQSADWVLPWFKAFAAPGRARVAVLRERGRLRALAPFTVTTTMLGPLPVRALALVRNAHSTRSGILCAQDDPMAAAVLVAGLLDRHPAWSLIELRDLSADSPTVPVLRRALRERGAATEWLTPALRTPIVPRAGTWEAYLDSRSHNFRRSLNRGWAKLERRGRGDVVCCRTPDEVRAGVRALATIEAASWKGAAGTALGTDERARAFYTDVATRFAARGAADLSVLRIDGAPIAACLALRHGRVMYGLKVSYDPAYAEGSPGLALALAMLERQWSGDIDRFDLMQTSTFPTDRLTDRYDERVLLRVFMGRGYGRVLGAVKRGYGRLRGTAATVGAE